MIVICKHKFNNHTVIGEIIGLKDGFTVVNSISNVMNTYMERTIINKEYIIYPIESYDFKGEDKELLMEYFKNDIIGARKYKLKLLENYGK